MPDDITTRMSIIKSGILNLNKISVSAFEDEQRSVKISFFLSMGILVLVLVTISYFSRINIVEPLEELATQASIVGKGKLKQKINVFRNDEIGNLANSFSSMIRQLKTLHDGLEGKVLQRTSQLSMKIEELEKAKKTMARVLQNLEKVNAKDKIILGSIGEGMIISDQKGDITFSNRACEDHFHLKPEEIRGKSIFYFIMPEDEKKTEEQPSLEETIISGKKINSVPGFIIRNNTKRIPITVTISPLLIQGKRSGSIILFHDVSHEREIQTMKQKFLAFVADQLRTPLGSMRWTIEMLLENQKEQLTPETKKNLESMHENNQRIIDLVNELLDVSTKDHDDLEKRIQQLSIT